MTRNENTSVLIHVMINIPHALSEGFSADSTKVCCAGSTPAQGAIHKVMKMEYSILSLDKAGNPHKWLTYEQACHYYATGHVVYDFGDTEVVLHGGFQRSGEQSVITIKSIIAVRGAGNAAFERSKTVPLRQSEMLYRRDHHMCAYCGETFHSKDLTRDHVKPKSRGGDNGWMNLVTACTSCNNRKDSKTPEEARMELLYLPYIPCTYERFILENRNIRGDQMLYLKAKLPAHSRYS